LKKNTKPESSVDKLLEMLEEEPENRKTPGTACGRIPNPKSRQTPGTA
jgi:hypothetical protein